MKYYSNNTTVAKVDENTGLVTIVGSGTANITIKAAANDKYDSTEKTITVTVSNPIPPETETQQ